MTKTTVSLEEMGDLHRVEEESKAQELPKQEKVFSIAKRVRSRLSNLPDPTHPPLGFVRGRGFDVVFPFIRLPELRVEETLEEAEEREQHEEPIFDMSDLPEVPEPPEELEPIAEWQKYLDEYLYDLRGMSIEQTISQIQSKNLDSGFDTLQKGDLPNIDVKDVDTVSEPTIEQLRYRLISQVRNLAYHAIMEYDRNPDARQEIILYVIQEHLKKRFLLGHSLYECENQLLLEMVWAVFDQIREVFLNPALIGGILASPPKSRIYEDAQGYSE